MEVQFPKPPDGEVELIQGEDDPEDPEGSDQAEDREAFKTPERSAALGGTEEHNTHRDCPKPNGDPFTPGATLSTKGVQD